MSKRGTSIAFAVFTLLVLSVLAAAIFSMLSTDVTSAGEMARAMKAFYIAESGKEIGARAVYDDKVATDSATLNLTNPAAKGYCGISFLEGGYGNSLLAVNVISSTVNNASFHGTSWNNHSPRAAVMMGKGGGSGEAYLMLWDFQQRYNLIGSKLLRLRMVVRARKQAANHPNVRLVMQYTTDGGITWTPDITGDMTGFVFDVTNPYWPWNVNSYVFSSHIPGVAWQNIMDSQNFRIRLYRLDNNTNRVEIDWFALEAVTEVDTLKEPWASRSYMSLPAYCGDGSIQDISIEDEAGKMNINNADGYALWHLFEKCGMSRGKAINLANRIDTYRAGGNRFDTTEEIKQITGVDEAAYNLIKDHITVYSVTLYSWMQDRRFIYYLGEVSPININTASANVLFGIMKSMGANDLFPDRYANDIVQAIIWWRSFSPFTSIYSSCESQTYDPQSFVGFIRILHLPWLNDNARRMIIELVDASRYNIGLTQNWYEPAERTPPFCYSSHTYTVSGKGRIDSLERVARATYGNLYDYTAYSWNTAGRFSLSTHIGDSNPQAYWRERLR